MREKILELLENKDFAKEIMYMKSKEEVAKALSDKGVVPTDAELDELGSMIREIIGKLETLPERELQEVAGGGHENSGFVNALVDVFDIFSHSRNVSARAAANSASSMSKAEIADANARIATTVALATIAATGIYTFRKEIKSFWYSSEKK